MKLKNIFNSKLMLVIALTAMLTLVATSFADENGESAGGEEIPDTQFVGEESSGPVQMINTHNHIFRAGLDDTQKSVPAPANLNRAVQTSRILVQFNPDSCEEATSPWPEEAKAAFQHATDIWSTIVKSKVTIIVDACWATLPTGVLGSARADNFWRDFDEAPMANTWYPSAIANALVGEDIDPKRSDIIATFNNQGFDWYFGTDGNPGANQFDFPSVILHEIGHGMGFAGSMVVLNDGRGLWGLTLNLDNAFPFSYDRFTRNGGLFLVTAYPNLSANLATALTSENIRFSGSGATSGNGGTNPELFAPSSWIQGTSYSHLDLSFGTTPDALMIGFLSRGVAIHDLGPISRGLINDVGWSGAAPGIPFSELDFDIFLPFVHRNQ